MRPLGASRWGWRAAMGSAAGWQRGKRAAPNSNLHRCNVRAPCRNAVHKVNKQPVSIKFYG